MPDGTTLPAAGDWESVTLQPVATTSGIKFGMTPSQSAFTGTALFVAQVVIVGAAGAITITAKSQFGPRLLVQVTSVTPTGKLSPEWRTTLFWSLQVTVPQVLLVLGSV